MMRLLCVMLLLAQLALADHGIEHANNQPDEACVACLAIPGMLAVPAGSSLAASAPAATALLSPSIAPAPLLAPAFSFLSRAPPQLRS